MIKRIFLLLTATLFFTMINPALALDLDQAKSQLGALKQQGVIGETPSGYLKTRGSASAAAQAVMKSINNARKATYQRIAKQRNTALSAVEQLAGKQAIAKTPSGQYVLVNGQWRKK